MYVVICSDGGILYRNFQGGSLLRDIGSDEQDQSLRTHRQVLLTSAFNPPYGFSDEYSRIKVSVTLSAHDADTRALDTYDTNNIKKLSRSVSITADTSTTNDHEDEESRHFLTQNSTSMPAWFKEYSISHREQRFALNETNWKNQTS